MKITSLDNQDEPHQETTLKTDQNEFSSPKEYPSKQSSRNLHPHTSNFSFSVQTSAPIASNAFSQDHSAYANQVKLSLNLSQNNSTDLTMLKDNKSSISKLPKMSVTEMHLANTAQKSMLDLLKYAKCSILVNCFSDVLTIVVPIFIICVFIGLRGVKRLKILFLSLYLVYLVISMAPYLYLEVFYEIVEVRVLCGIVLVIKAFNFFMVSWVICRIARMSMEQKVKIAMDFYKSSGTTCLCC